MSNLGCWDHWYTGVMDPRPYADTATYQLGAEWLKGLQMEDWGCGLGWMRTHIPPSLYTGIDGSQSEFADRIVDLTQHRSDTPGLFMRHVLEHNWDWEAILENAVASFTHRMFLVLFTPTIENLLDADLEPDAAIEGVPTLSLSMPAILSYFDDLQYSCETVPSAARYGQETIFRLEK